MEIPCVTKLSPLRFLPLSSLGKGVQAEGRREVYLKLMNEETLARDQSYAGVEEQSTLFRRRSGGVASCTRDVYICTLSVAASIAETLSAGAAGENGERQCSSDSGGLAGERQCSSDSGGAETAAGSARTVVKVG